MIKMAGVMARSREEVRNIQLEHQQDTGIWKRYRTTVGPGDVDD
jgi:hypothetical protein